MTRRKLTDQQHKRITTRQTHKREQSSAEQQGLVMASYGRRVRVAMSPQHQLRCHQRQNLGAVVVGDHVIVSQADKGNPVISAINPRKNTLYRTTPAGYKKPVAANIDVIYIVIAPMPAPKEILIDRYCVAAELLKVQPCLIINKTDIIPRGKERYFSDLKAIYSEIGYDVLETNLPVEQGLRDLHEHLKGHSSIFVGQSGVGKSSLLGKLLNNPDIKIGAISAAHQKGQHTTTTAQLYPFPLGGHLIDSPGVRDFACEDLTTDEVLRGFRELQTLKGQCQFRNCAHINTPGCALEQAADEKRIHPKRWESFQRMLLSLQT